MIKFYFNISTFEPNYCYPHGFIDSKAVLPADFCELGIERFVLDCLNFPDAVSNKIGESINIKAKELGNIKKVIPVNMINYFTEKYDKVEV